MMQDIRAPQPIWRVPSVAAACWLAAFVAISLTASTTSAARSDKPTGCDISVITEPSQATVLFDGNKEQSVTPVTIHAMPGTHFMVINKAGYAESRQRFTVEAEQSKMLLETKLEPVLGLALIHSVPTGAEVTIDEAQRGQTPLLLTELRPGRYRVRASLQGFIPVERILEISDRVPQKVDIVLRRDSGVITCTSDPTGAELAVNGSSYGRTPCKISGMPPGKANILITLDGYEPHRATVAVRAGDDLSVKAILKPLPATLDVVSVPEGGIVYL
ncbi:MAG: PEGA domain-containing protein, partial [bacterium]